MVLVVRNNNSITTGQNNYFLIPQSTDDMARHSNLPFINIIQAISFHFIAYNKAGIFTPELF